MVVKGIPRPVVDDEQLEVAVVEEIAGVAPPSRIVTSCLALLIL